MTRSRAAWARRARSSGGYLFYLFTRQLRPVASFDLTMFIDDAADNEEPADDYDDVDNGESSNTESQDVDANRHDQSGPEITDSLEEAVHNLFGLVLDIARSRQEQHVSVIVVH